MRSTYISFKKTNVFTFYSLFKEQPAYFKSSLLYQKGVFCKLLKPQKLVAIPQTEQSQTLVDPVGFEPTTFSLQMRRATTAPWALAQFYFNLLTKEKPALAGIPTTSKQKGPRGFGVVCR